jgi:hypothetical protein
LLNLDGMDWIELGEAAVAFDDLAEYARKKRLAVAYRAVGNVLEARYYEDQCETIYQRFPAWGKW